MIGYNLFTNYYKANLERAIEKSRPKSSTTFLLKNKLNLFDRPFLPKPTKISPWAWLFERS
jgi:hypothetical protein